MLHKHDQNFDVEVFCWHDIRKRNRSSSSAGDMPPLVLYLVLNKALGLVDDSLNRSVSIKI